MLKLLETNEMCRTELVRLLTALWVHYLLARRASRPDAELDDEEREKLRKGDALRQELGLPPLTFEEGAVCDPVEGCKLTGTYQARLTDLYGTVKRDPQDENLMQRAKEMLNPAYSGPILAYLEVPHTWDEQSKLNCIFRVYLEKLPRSLLERAGFTAE